MYTRLLSLACVIGFMYNFTALLLLHPGMSQFTFDSWGYIRILIWSGGVLGRGMPVADLHACSHPSMEDWLTTYLRAHPGWTQYVSLMGWVRSHENSHNCYHGWMKIGFHRQALCLAQPPASISGHLGIPCILSCVWTLRDSAQPGNNKLKFQAVGNLHCTDWISTEWHFQRYLTSSFVGLKC